MYMDHPDLTISNFMGNSIDTQRVKAILLLWLIFIISYMLFVSHEHLFAYLVILQFLVICGLF